MHVVCYPKGFVNGLCLIEMLCKPDLGKYESLKKKGKTCSHSM